MALLAEYPKNVSSTAFASFLEIERLQYKKGLEKAGGATETLLTSGLAGVLGGIGGKLGLYNIEQIIQTMKRSGLKSSVNYKEYHLPLADNWRLGTAQEQASKYNLLMISPIQN